jgi:hypothetical protein
MLRPISFSSSRIAKYTGAIVNFHRGLGSGKYVAGGAGLNKADVPPLVQQYDEIRSQEYKFKPNSQKLQRVSQSKNLKQYASDVVWHFLPRSYPSSVTNGYDKFAIGQFVSTVMGTTCGVLSMQSMLFAIGVGSGSMPLAATLNWIIKDGLGQFGGIIFASFVNNQFDADPKRWRMISGLSMDVSSLLELMTPLAPAYFLPIAAVANVGKNISFLSASASRAAIHKSLCQHENLADITAKTGSQCIVGSLCGTSLGLSIAAYLGQDYYSIVTAFVACSSIGLWATYLSLKNVTLTTLSLSRLDALLEHHVAHPRAPLLSPVAVRRQEEYLGSNSNMLPLHIGSDLDEAVSSQQELSAVLSLYKEERYLLTAHPGGPSQSIDIHLLFKQDVTKRDMLKGMYNAFLLRRDLAERGFASPSASQTLRWKVLPENEKGQSLDHWEEARLQACYALTQKSHAGESFADKLLSASEDNQSTASVGARDSPDAWLVDGLLLETRVARIQ